MSLFKHTVKRIRNIAREKAELSSLGKPAVKEKALMAELRQGMKALHGKPANASEFWSKKRNELFEQVMHHDPRNFTRWEVMYPMFFEPADAEFEALRSSPHWKIFERALREDRIGNPKPYPKYPSSSGNLVHHAYSLNEFLLKTGRDLGTMNVLFEFGGGYGSFCRLCYRMGFRGHYIIFDLPEYSLFQNYFLKSVDIPLNVTRSFGEAKSGTVSLLSDTAAIPAGIIPDLFIALWSVSETPVDLRESVLQKIGAGKNFLFGFQDTFQGINNREYFSAYTAKRKDVAWTSLPIAHIQNNHYLFGKTL